MSDFAEQLGPKETRSGTIYDNNNLSIYTKIGCQPVNDWDEPERICDVNIINKKIFDFIK